LETWLLRWFHSEKDEKIVIKKILKKIKEREIGWCMSSAENGYGGCAQWFFFFL
jgi:hypothetical protein